MTTTARTARALAAAALLLTAGVASAQDGMRAGDRPRMNMAQLERVMANWPAASKEAARKMYGEQIMAMKAMKPAPYTERLTFATMSDTGDPDRPLGPMSTGARP